MVRSLWFLLCVSAAYDPSVAAAKPPELYEKCGSLQQTMLTARARLQQWQTGQREAMRAVQAGPWYGTSAGNDVSSDPAAASRVAPQAALTPSTSGPLWQAFVPTWNPWATDLLPGIFSVEPLSTDYLATTIHVDQPVTLTFELSRYEWYGGFAYRP